MLPAELLLDLENKEKVVFSKKPFIVMIAFILGATVASALGSAASQDEESYRVIVHGGPDADGLVRLQLFNQKLMAALHVTDLALANIGCVECADLFSGPAETSLTYYIPERIRIVNAFATTWRKVQQVKPHDLFTMEFDSVPPPSATCPPITDCKARYACPPTDFCDKPYGGLCNKCT